jgi:hypothetical protein
MATSKHRGWSHGTTFDASELEADLACEDWEADSEDDDREVRRVYLGTIFSLTPSGKIYMPFACSNVAGDCPVCKGEGSTKPRTGKRVRARARAQQSAFSRRTVKRNASSKVAREIYVQRVAKARHAAFVRASTTCHACDGLGSISAARDERWNEALEELASSIDAYVDYYDDSIFLAQSRDRVSDEVPEERKRRLIARGILWEHIGGGCVLVGNLEYPGDDTYENLKTGQLAEFSTTLEAHQSIPHELRTLAQITRRKGVKLLSKKVWP